MQTEIDVVEGMQFDHGYLSGYRNTDRWSGDFDDLGLQLKDTTMEMLGQAASVKITKDNTTIVNGAVLFDR